MSTFNKLSRERREKLDQLIRKEKIGAEEARQLRGELEAKIEREAQRRGGFIRKAAGSVAAAGITAADTATLGFLPQIGGALGADREKLEAATIAARDVNPIASTAGGVAGIFSPGGAVRQLGGLGARGATRALGTGRLAAAATRSADVPRSLQFGAQAANAFAGGAGALASIGLAEDRNDKAGIAQRLSDIADQVSSPVNIGVSLGLGGLATKAIPPVFNEELQKALTVARRRGIPIPADVATDEAGLQRLLSDLAQAPGTRGFINRFLQRDVWRPINEWMKDVASRAGGGRRASQATRAVQREAGVAQGVGSTRGSLGRVTTERRARQKEALDPIREDFLSRETAERLSAALSDQTVRLTNVAAGSAGNVLNKIRKDVIRVLGGGDGTMRIGDAAEFLERLRGAAKFKNALNPGDPNSSELARREASKLWVAFRRAIRSDARPFDQALRSGQRLRRMEDALSDVQVPRLPDDSVLGELVKGKLATQKLAAFSQRASTEEVQALRGWYISRFIETASSKEGRLTASSLERLFRGKGEFNRNIFDRVMGSFTRNKWNPNSNPREELMTIARVTDQFSKGIGQAQGSRTAFTGATLATLGAITFAPQILMTQMDDFMSNPLGSAAGALSTVGMALLIRKTAGSAVRGNIAGQFGAVASGQPALAPGGVSIPVAAQRASSAGEELLGATGRLSGEQ